MVASVWRRAWRSKVSSTTQQGGGGILLQPTCGRSTTSGTTYTNTTTYTLTSDSTGELPRDFCPFMALPTAPVVEENAEELDVAKEIEDDRVRKLEQIKGLVLEFSGGNRLTAMERWLSELDVGWVLRLAEINESAVLIWRHFQYLADSWILALRKCLDGWCGCGQDHDEETNKRPPISGFIQLVEATVLKMLAFVDAILAAAARTNDRSGARTTAEKLQVLIEVHGALSTALEHILSSSPSSVFGESTQVTMRDLLSADLAKLDEAIWDTIVEIRNNILTWIDDDGIDPYRLSYPHKTTHWVTGCAKVLLANCELVNRILHDAVLHGDYVPENEDVSHLSNLIIEIARSLEETLTTKSRSWFPDQGLRFLFLINNFHFILRTLGFPILTLINKIDEYINSYLEVSWAPVLKCLHHPATPRCFTWYSPLAKFKSKFLKTYTVQKLWKVPDPAIRKRMRTAIIKKVIPIFTQFVEHNSIIITPGVITPRKIEMMLGELFEG